MITLRPMKYALSLIILAAILIGCTTQNPNWTKPLPGQPDTNQVPQFVPDPKIHSYSNQVIMGADAIAPFNPYAGLTRPVLEAVFGVVGLISAGLATRKSNKLTKSLNVMGAGVVKAGTAQAVLDHASNTDHFLDVAQAINRATGANQNNVGTPKT